MSNLNLVPKIPSFQRLICLRVCLALFCSHLLCYSLATAGWSDACRSRYTRNGRDTKTMRINLLEKLSSKETENQSCELVWMFSEFCDSLLYWKMLWIMNDFIFPPFSVHAAINPSSMPSTSRDTCSGVTRMSLRAVRHRIVLIWDRWHVRTIHH